jgi:hypothetical protein
MKLHGARSCGTFWMLFASRIDGLEGAWSTEDVSNPFNEFIRLETYRQRFGFMGLREW